jgi:hypothetical protein
VQREKRQSGADVWVFRWWESTFDGTNKRRKAIVGTVQAFPTEASALKAAKALRIDANQQTPHFDGGPETIAELVAHHAMRYEWVERNPIKLVRQSAKRERTPDILELAELQLLLSKLAVYSGCVEMK